jgi:hypothetical protein
VPAIEGAGEVPEPVETTRPTPIRRTGHGKNWPH